jgi:hypothetical protein
MRGILTLLCAVFFQIGLVAAQENLPQAPGAGPNADKAKSSSELVGAQKKAFDYAIDNLIEKTEQGGSGGPSGGVPNNNDGKSLSDAPNSELGELKDAGSLLGM